MKKFIIAALLLPGILLSATPADQQLPGMCEYNRFLSGLRLPSKLDFCGEPIPLDNPEVLERAEREFYNIMQSPGVMILYIKRAGRCFPLIEKKLKEHNLPDDLKYISVAESGLVKHAKSSCGAMGYWQLMPGTAQSHGLIVDELVDERRDIEKSTEAAIEYLTGGYKQHHSWVLTAAGYNMGNSGIQKSKDYQSAENYFDMYLNEETSRYIFRIAIFKEIMQNKKKYGFDMPDSELYKDYSTELLRVDEAVPDLAAWAKANGTTYKDVKILNPWILKRQLPKPPKGGHWEVAVPKEARKNN